MSSFVVFERFDDLRLEIEDNFDTEADRRIREISYLAPDDYKMACLVIAALIRDALVSKARVK